MRKALPICLAMMLAPNLAWAHPGSAAHDALHGLLHPLTGLDHILAMVSVGLLAAQRGGRALWLMPLAFVSMMAVGGVLGVSGVALPGVETAIGLSVMVLGALVLTGLRIPDGLTAGLVGAFAIFHGHAHGAEIPAAASALPYGIAFITATALLHGIGIALYLGFTRAFGSRGARLMQAAGGAIALAGVALMLGLG